MRLNIILLCVLTVAALSLSGCGQTGDLYLPDQDNKKQNKS